MTGQSPTDIENTWDHGDIYHVLAVYQAREQARLMLAERYKTEVHNIFPPMSVTVLDDAGDGKPRRRYLGRDDGGRNRKS